MSTNIASGVYPLYKSLNILNALQITEVFAAYIFGLIPTLLISSWLYSKYGLRIVMLTALTCSIIGTLIIGLGNEFSYFLCGRIFQGVAVGLSTSNLAAAIVRLEPNGNHHRAALATGLAMTNGGGLAPIIGALIAQYFAHPTLTPYLIIVLLLCMMLPLTFSMPHVRNSNPKINLPRVPHSHKDVFKRSATAAFLAWTVPAIFLSVVPVVVASHLPNSNLIYPAIAAGAVLIVSGITQALGMRLKPERALQYGYYTLVIAASLLIYGEFSSAFSMILASSVLGGVGHGLTFLGATRLLNATISKLEARTEILAAYNIAIYLGVGIPVFCVGVLSTLIQTSEAVCLFGGFVIALSAYNLVKNRNKKFEYAQ